MNQRFTYSIPTHALPFPATADRICVAGPRPHTYGVRHLPCNPLATEPCRPTACDPCGYPRLTARYSLFPAHSTDATPARPAHPILHSSFFILNWTYTFSAKEKDVETGLSYFGSHYYSSDLSVWLSVDPMSDKYPSTSPYAYCRNNPIILVDDNGNKDRPFNPEKDQGQTILQNINTPFSYVFDSKGRKIGYSISNYFTCYNCHSYAWNNSLGSKYSKAVNYLGLALSGGGAPFGIS